LGKENDLSLIRITQADGVARFPNLELILQAGDVVLIEGTPQHLLAATDRLGLEPVTRQQFAELQELAPEETTFIEIALSNRTAYAGITLAEIGFRRRYGCTVMGIRHGGEARVTHLGDVPLNFGDSLLVAGPVDKVDLLRQDRNFLALDMPPLALRRTHKAPQAILILAGALALVTTGWLDVATTLLIGAIAMVVAGVLTMDEAYAAIDWKSVFLIAGMLPLGTAMAETGTAALLAGQLTELLGTASPLLVLGGVFLLTALLTEVISNAAATVLVVPIAIDTALVLGADPHPFVMATVLAASTSFLMPIGHQVNVIVFGPGGYRFSDYTRVGLGLNLLMLALVVSVLPIFWPLFP
jgi:di/tricarboxylate transporter